MRKKNFEMGVGKYYFTVKSGHQMVTIHRKTKEAAREAFLMYQKVGKACEWLGCWDGKDFKESSAPMLVN